MGQCLGVKGVEEPQQPQQQQQQQSAQKQQGAPREAKAEHEALHDETGEIQRG
jgi:hypothetical protein